MAKDQNQGGAQQQPKKEETSLVAILSDGDKGKLTYNVNGQDVALSYGIVRQFLTRGEGGLKKIIYINKYLLFPFANLTSLTPSWAKPTWLNTGIAPPA